MLCPKNCVPSHPCVQIDKLERERSCDGGFGAAGRRGRGGEEIERENWRDVLHSENGHRTQVKKDSGKNQKLGWLGVYVHKETGK